MNTEQFWQGEFGDKYTERNVDLVENNYQMFGNIFYNDDYNFTCDIESIIEFGAGSGQNILALQRIFSDADYAAIEINKIAFNELCEIKNDKLDVLQDSILNWDFEVTYDLVLTKGLLIHIHPDDILKAYEVLYQVSNKYILMCEYYSPNRIMIPYRGEDDKLWKFDFAGEMISRYPVKIIDYGFVSKYDQYPQDDLTWFLMEK